MEGGSERDGSPPVKPLIDPTTARQYSSGMEIDRHTMTTQDVARALGLSVERVRQLDAVLVPVRLEGNGQRRYAPGDVERFAAGRAK